jgi:phage tail-like protein
MAVMRERPYSGAHFLVAIGEGDGRSAAEGFAEVVFPPFVLPHAHEGATGATPVEGLGEPSASRLVLRRGMAGSLDLYRWWDESRRAAAPPTRTVTIALLADDHETVVLTWRFRRAYPVSVSYSPLRAVEGGIVMETVELAFDRVDMS